MGQTGSEKEKGQVETSPKALAITTAIMITFKNFNLYRLLSQQVAPVCLDREQPGGNAFLNFFERVTTGHQTYFE